MKNIIDYIQVFNQAVPDSLCDEIINEYKKTKEWQTGTIGEYDINLDIRKCDSIFISKPETIEINPIKRKELDNQIYEIVSKHLNEYFILNSLTKANVQSDSGYSLLRYKKGQYIKEHIDSSSRSARELSLSINLNDNYTGGEFAFFNRETVYKLKKGDIIMFPSNFMYPHEVMPIKFGTRYAIITWIA